MNIKRIWYGHRPYRGRFALPAKTASRVPTVALDDGGGWADNFTSAKS